MFDEEVVTLARIVAEEQDLLRPRRHGAAAVMRRQLTGATDGPSPTALSMAMLCIVPLTAKPSAHSHLQHTGETRRSP